MKNFLLITGILILLTCCNKKEHPVWEKLLTFTTEDSIRSIAPEAMGVIVIQASGGRLPYEFYVIPEEQWFAGDNMLNMLQENNFSRLHRYTYYFPVIEVYPGSATTPRNYWVALQDDTESAPVSGTNIFSWWKRVSVYDWEE